MSSSLRVSVRGFSTTLSSSQGLTYNCSSKYFPSYCTLILQCQLGLVTKWKNARIKNYYINIYIYVLSWFNCQQKKQETDPNNVSIRRKNIVKNINIFRSDKYTGGDLKSWNSKCYKVQHVPKRSWQGDIILKLQQFLGLTLP